MSLAQVLKNLNNIEATSSTNEKVQLLKGYLKDETFLKVVKFALSRDMRYHIKSIPETKKRTRFEPFTTEEIFNFLKQLSTQTGASNADKNHLAEMLTSESDFEVVKRIVTKDLKCGVSAKLVNKALSGTVNTVPYMRCSTDKKLDNINYEAIIQEKADGMFVNVMINSKGQIKILTRNGKIVHQMRHLKNLILNGRPERTPKNKKITERWGILNNGFKDSHLGMVYTGELLVKKKGKILPRKTGNGILNSCLQGSAHPDDTKCVILRVWDCLPLKKFYEGYHDVLYNTRVFETSKFVRAVNDKEFVDMVMTKRVKSYAEAHSFYAKIRAAGGEGAILKNLDAVWKDHTSTDMVKMKNVEEAELEIVGWEPGKEGSKYEMCMGALRCQSSCGLLKVKVGSGFSDEEREADWDLAVGAIITVEFESVIQDKRTKRYSLFLPRFKEVREERDVADTMKEIQER